ncbi:MAG: spermidine/putrescine ABC transporter substrate-binding protein [Gammaproteobacteria bacterium]
MSLASGCRTLAAALTLVFAVACAAAGGSPPTGGTQPVRELVVLTWADYMSPELVKAFEQQARVKVKFVYFTDDDERDKMMVDARAGEFDILCINEVSLPSYVRADWLEPLPADQIPNRANIAPRWRNRFPEARDYAVAYFWGTLGIAYRTDLVSAPITSWKQLFSPDPKLRGRIAMIGHSRDLIGMALKSLGYSANSTDHEQLKQAKALLLAQKPFVKTYDYVSDPGNSPLVDGTAAAAVMFSGDALRVQEVSPKVRYALPAEGGNLWVDYLAILKTSTRKTLAKEFLDFINAPKMAAMNAGYVTYATPNAAAEKLMPADYLQNPSIYPSQAVVDRSEYYAELPPRVEKIYNEIKSQVIR